MKTSAKPKGKDGKGPRRLLELDTEEVSLVDLPAIRRRFLIIKRLEDEMGGAFKEGSEAGTPEPTADGTTSPEQQTPEQVAKTKTADEQQPAGEPDPKPAATEPAATEPTAKADGEDSPAATEPAATPVAEPVTEPAQKAEGINIQIQPDGGINISGEPIAKGKSFTVARTAAIKDITIKLVGLLAGVDKTNLADISTAIKTLQAGTSPPSAVRPTKKGEGDEPEPTDAEGVLKSLLGKLDTIVKGQEDLAKRVTDIETARSPSTVVEVDDTATTPDEVQKGDKGLWDGVV